MAYTFLTVDDVLTRIRDEHINDLTDSTAMIQETCESQALEVVKSHLNGRYDVAAIFTASPRKQLLVLHVLNIFIYLLYRRINPRKMPEEVKNDHADSLDWLKDVAHGKISPDLPVFADPEDLGTNDLRTGGGHVMKGHYF